MDLENLYNSYETSENGLANEEAKNRLLKYGTNELPEEKIPSIFAIFFSQFINPLIYILLLAAVLSFIVGEHVDSYFILVVVSFNAVIGTIQEYSAHKSALSLKKVVEVKTFVIRDGNEIEIPTKDLGVGDIVVLKEGNKVPADLILTHSKNLKVDESMLTGESIAVEKKCDFQVPENASLQEKLNECFAGTIVIKGHGKGIVKATGLYTEIGKIADKITQKNDVKSPLVERMENFTNKLTRLRGVMMVMLACRA